MNDVDLQLHDFKMFLESVCNDVNYKNHKPYLLSSLIESYYEYIAKILDEKISCKDNQFIRLERLLKKDKIKLEIYHIMDRTRIIRNGFSHDLSYFPSDEDIINYHTIVTPWSTPKIGALFNKDDRVFSLNCAIIQGYCFVSGNTMNDLREAVSKIMEMIDKAKN
jgi:hypothetical protein